MLCDPEPAIARARASQDDNAHRPLFVRPIPILVLATASWVQGERSEPRFPITDVVVTAYEFTEILRIHRHPKNSQKS